MKYLVVLCDGMADRPLDSLSGMTPMEYAEKPIMDMLASRSLVGTVLNVPPTMVPESDTANLSVLSYDPIIYSKGRSPLEAAAMGIIMEDCETAFRCNLVTLEEGELEYSERRIIDHGADNISSEEAAVLVAALEEELSDDDRHFHPGMSYRESMIVKNAPDRVIFSRPHDIPGKVIGPYLPAGEDGHYYTEIMKKSYEVLNSHPINEERRKKGLHVANSVWFWSPGKKAALPSFKEKWGLSATMISAVDLLKGIGFLAGMKTPSVEGATGTVDTNYSGKAKAAIDAFESGDDFVYIHLEGPDECGHCGDTEGKVRAIESIDSLVLAPLYDYLSVSGDDFKIMVLPDHPTPLEIRTHSSEPVPFFIYSSKETLHSSERFTEKSASESPVYFPEGKELLDLMIEREKDPAPLSDGDDKIKEETPKDANSETVSPSEDKRKKSSTFVDFLEVISISLVAVLLLMTLIVRLSPVIGASMEPTLHQGDVLLVSDLFYTPKIGDIVIIQVDKPTKGASLDRPLVQRIIAVGGDRVSINFKTWEIDVNGLPIDQSYLDPAKIKASAMKNYAMETDDSGICEFTVSEGCVFVLGDNRNDSLDSRTLGEIDERCIVGRAVFRLFPLNSMGKP